MDVIFKIQEISNSIISTCISFPTLTVSESIKENETIMKSYQEKKVSMSKLASLNMEKSKQNVAKEMEVEGKELRDNNELRNELRQLLIESQTQRLQYIRGVQDDILSTIIHNPSESRENERTILDLIRQRDRLVIRLQKEINDYQRNQQDISSISEKNRELQQQCDGLMTEITEQSTFIQEMEDKVDEATKEEQRHNLIGAERKYNRQKKENDILRNIYSSLVLVSKIDWSRKERIRELMLSNEEAPGVPEKDLQE